jgi:hypothetical protein
MPLMTIEVGNFDGGRKVLNYLKYTKNSDPNARIQVFKQAIKTNGVT